MKENLHKITYCLILIILLDIIQPLRISGAVKTSSFETIPWNTVAESSIIDQTGWLQAICATDQYIVCLVNASRNGTEPDTLLALYRNNTDKDGRPVKQYSYAFHVTEMDYEHGNGMTYNPDTGEIAIAGLFNNGRNNQGAVFIVDAETLHFKRKVQVGDGKWNYFGIDYIPERQQYVLMANRPADYSFVFTDANFQITDVMNLNLSSSRSSFQDFCVAGDFIISLPYMQRDGFMDLVDIYSISQKTRVGSYYLALPDSAFSVEPEGICQLEPGHFLAAAAVKGSTVFKLYEIHLPLVYQVTTQAVNGTITQSASEVDAGGSYTVSYQSDENYRLEELLIDGNSIDPKEYPNTYTFSDIQENHSIQAVYQEIPRYTVSTQVLNGTIDRNPSGFEQDPLTVHFSPYEHYELDVLKIDGQEIDLDGTETSYTFSSLTQNHTLEVLFKKIPSYTLQITAVNGSVQRPQVTVYRGESYTAEAEPDRFCQLTRCLVDDKPVVFPEKENFTLENIRGNHTITLIYSRNDLAYGILLFLCFLVIMLLFTLIRSERKKHRLARSRELRRIRRTNRRFFQTLEDLEDLENHPPQDSLGEEDFYFLLDELNKEDPPDKP